MRSREREDEEGGDALAEALEGRRSQCTAGECNTRALCARQYGALRQRVHSTSLYTDRSVLSLLLVGATIGTHINTHIHVRSVVVSARSNSSMREVVVCSASVAPHCRSAL